MDRRKYAQIASAVLCLSCSATALLFHSVSGVYEMLLFGVIVYAAITVFCAVEITKRVNDD